MCRVGRKTPLYLPIPVMPPVLAAAAVERPRSISQLDGVKDDLNRASVLLGNMLVFFIKLPFRFFCVVIWLKLYCFAGSSHVIG